MENGTGPMAETRYVTYITAVVVGEFNVRSEDQEHCGMRDVWHLRYLVELSYAVFTQSVLHEKKGNPVTSDTRKMSKVPMYMRQNILVAMNRTDRFILPYKPK
jgi:hypothetical protein